MTTIALEDMKPELADCIRKIQAGETLIILDGGQPIAEFKTMSVVGQNLQERPIGLCAGHFIVPDDFDAPLPEEFLRLWEGV